MRDHTLLQTGPPLSCSYYSLSLVMLCVWCWYQHGLVEVSVSHAERTKEFRIAWGWIGWIEWGGKLTILKENSTWTDIACHCLWLYVFVAFSVIPVQLALKPKDDSRCNCEKDCQFLMNSTKCRCAPNESAASQQYYVFLWFPKQEVLFCFFVFFVQLNKQKKKNHWYFTRLHFKTFCLNNVL